MSRAELSQIITLPASSSPDSLATSPAEIQHYYEYNASAEQREKLYVALKKAAKENGVDTSEWSKY